MIVTKDDPTGLLSQLPVLVPRQIHLSDQQIAKSIGPRAKGATSGAHPKNVYR